MPQSAISSRRAWRLTPLHEADKASLLRARVGSSEQAVLLPHSRGLAYIVVPAEGDVAFATEDFRAELLGPLASLWARLRLALIVKTKKRLSFPAFGLYASGPKPKRKHFTRFNQDMTNIGLTVDGALAARHPELLEGWPDAAKPAFRAGGPRTIAVVLHMYYEETWPDIAGALSAVGLPFDLIVTTVPGRERLVEDIRGAFPDAEIAVMENRGRDVRPFLALLESGRLDRYAAVCKIHGKKSADGDRKYLGALWRRRMLFDLLAAPGRARAVVAAFQSDPSIGMVGASAFRLPRDTYNAKLSWAANGPLVLKYAEAMGVPPDRFRLDFFGGTMFWVRPEALKPLRDLKLAEAMPEEKGLLDGGLEHAVERLFATAVVAAGYRLAESDHLPPEAPRAAQVAVAFEPSDSADARACLDAYFAELASRFDGGFDTNASPSPAAEYAPPHGAFVMARLDGKPAGIGALKALDASTGEIKRLWTAPGARGLGVARRILRELESEARARGFARLRLDTNRTLTEARAFYEKEGYREIPRYNDNPYADHWFEKTLGG